MNKKIASVVLISLFLLAAVPSAIADDDRYYLIGPVDLFLEVQDSGLLEVREEYEYNFHGQYEGVYRDIPLQDGQSIENLKVSVKGAYAKITTDIEDDNCHVKVYLYSNREMTKPISRDAEVTVIYEYDFANAVKVYNDVGELQFKLWGENWEESGYSLTAEIEFPEEDNIQYWTNPTDVNATVTQNGNTVTVKSDDVPDNRYLEFRGIIPLSEFKDPVYAKHIDGDGKDDIIKAQEDYANGENFKSQMLSVLPIVFIISLAFPLFLYFRYGREPKIGYNAPYERELPAKLEPMFVNAMFSTKLNTGSISDDGIHAVIMEMIRDNVIGISKKDDSENIRLILPESTDGLSDIKKRIISEVLAPYAIANVVDFEGMKKKLNDKQTAREFQDALRSIKNDYKKEHVKPVLGEYFENKGYKYYLGYCAGMAVLSFALVFLSGFMGKFDSFMIMLFFFILFTMMCAIPNRITGRWTVKSYTEYRQWKAFEKYIKDFSLIREHPPESVAIWDDYIIYATALGDAKAVRKAMDAIGPDLASTNSRLYYYHATGGSLGFTSAVISSYSSTGASGPGGGSGGGGGGAF